MICTLMKTDFRKYWMAHSDWTTTFNKKQNQIRTQNSNKSYTHASQTTSAAHDPHIPPLLAQLNIRKPL